MIRRFAILLLTVAAASTASTAEQPENAGEYVERVILESRIRDQSKQARLLIRMLWLEGEVDADVADYIEERLVGFKKHLFRPAMELFREVPAEHQAELVALVIRGRLANETMFPPDYLPMLQTALWYGTREAKRLTMPELARNRDRMSILPMIDAAIEDPELLPDTIRALSIARDERSRFFLRDQLFEGSPEIREAAADALAKLKGRGLDPLREGIRSDNPEIRVASVKALLPVTTIEDLSALYDYYANFPDDDESTRAAVRQVALKLEMLLQQRQAEEAASPLPDR